MMTIERAWDPCGKLFSGGRALTESFRLAAMIGEAAVISTMVRIGLRTTGAVSTLRRAEKFASTARRASTAPNQIVDSDLVARVVRAVGRRRPFRFTCLPRSITTMVMLQRRGIAALVLIGIAGGAQTFSSHAWVQSGGRPVGEDANEIASLSVLPMERVLGHSRILLARGLR